MPDSLADVSLRTSDLSTIYKVRGEFVWPSFWDLDALNDIEPQPWANYFKYEDRPTPQRFVTGKGNFTLYRDLDSLYPGIYGYCALNLSLLLGLDIRTICQARPDIAKTTHGGLTPHVDLGRPCAINIGLKNTSRATFQHSHVHRFTSNDKLEQPVEVTMQDGGVYPVGVCWPHAVDVEPGVERYLLTYALSVPYLQLVKALDGRLETP